MKRIHILITFISLFILTGCGDLFTKKEEQKEIKLNELALCDLDTEAFKSILERNIQSDIACLKDSLNVFISAVKTDRPGYISKKILKEFLVTGPLDIEGDVIDIVDSIFDLAYIIIGGERNYIKKEDAQTLIDFVSHFNKHIWKSYKYFTSEDEVNFSRHLKEREIVFSDLKAIAIKLDSILNKNRSEVQRIDLERFIVSFMSSSPDLLNKVKSFIFLKRTFLGGENWTLTNLEMENLIKIIPGIAKAGYDVVKMEFFEFKTQNHSLVKIFLNDLDIVRNSLFYGPDSKEVNFNIFDVLYALDSLDIDLVDGGLTQYAREIIKVKEVLLGRGGEHFAGDDIHGLVDHLDEVLSKSNLFYNVYAFYAEELNSTEPITHDFSEFEVHNSKEEEYLQDFAKIVNNYKFLKGSYTLPYFTHKYYRNPNAYIEIAGLEYLIKLVMSKYGSVDDKARGGAHMTLDQTVGLVEDFKWILKDIGIITIGKKGGGEVAGVADNFVLMSTLFQFQSDGCSGDKICMEVPEATEFLTGLITALDVKDFFIDQMLELCKDDLDSFDRIAPTCFRNNFIKVIETPIKGDGRRIADYMPLFYEYLQGLVKGLDSDTPIIESKKYKKFILETESFTRTCMYYDKKKTDEVYLKATDAFAVFAGLLNVESTILRFDADKNNVVDSRNSFGKNEVLRAYNDVYKGAVKALVVDQAGALFGRFSRPIFQYLVKYGKVPDTSKFKSIWQFLRFLLKSNKNADLNRVNVASILKTLSEQSENGKLHPFKCEECLRDPTVQCEPEGKPWQ